MKDLTFIGIGGAYALGLGGNCAYLKEDKSLLLIDCCEDATIKLKERNAFYKLEDITIAITHTHSDHVAGLGTFIWYCNFILSIKPKIVSSSNSFENHLTELLKLLGVDSKFFEFINPANVVIGDCKIEMISTRHTPMLESFGIMFFDIDGQYYYTGDTNDFEYIKTLANKAEINKIYCEASWESYNAHIAYEKLKEIKNDKLILMHFEDVQLYKLAIKDGFNVAKI